MARTLITVALALAAVLYLAAGPAEAQRRSDSNESFRNRDRDRNGADLVVRRIRINGDDVRVEIENIGDRFAPPSRLAVIVVSREGRRTFPAEVPGFDPARIARSVSIRTSG